MNRNTWMIGAFALTLLALPGVNRRYGNTTGGKERARQAWAESIGHYSDEQETPLFFATGDFINVTETGGTDCGKTLDFIGQNQDFLWKASAQGFRYVSCGGESRRITIATPADPAREDIAENRY